MRCDNYCEAWKDYEPIIGGLVLTVKSMGNIKKVCMHILGIVV